MTDRSPILVAVRFTDENDTATQVVMWREGNTTAIQYRRQPDATSPGARWKPRASLPARLWKQESESAKTASIGTVQGYLSSLVSADAVSVEGVWTVEFSDDDNDALDEGAAQPNNLFTKISKRFSSASPRTWRFDTLTEACEWLVTGPMLALDNESDLAQYTESVLGSAPIPVAELDEGEDDGILLSDGVTRFVPRMMRGGLTDVTFLRTAREHKQTVLLVGPPGTGKSALVEAAFHADYAKAGLDFNQDALIIGTEDTTTTDLIGGVAQDKDGIFRFKPGKAIKCAQAGVPLFMDEALLTDPRVLSVLYSLIDGRGVLPLPEEFEYTDPVSGMENAVKAQPGFYAVFAGNPDVPGAVISEALKSRCKLRPEYLTDWDTVERLLGPAHEEIIRACRNFDTKRVEEGDVQESPQMREMLAYRDIAAVFGTEMALANLLTFFDSDSDKELFLDVVSRTMHVSNIPTFRV
jgi:nitric oxide reductase NorQ protein